MRREVPVVAKWIKSASADAQRVDARTQIAATVSKVIADVRTRGDEAVRAFSEEFDRWSPLAFGSHPRTWTGSSGRYLPKS